MKTKTDLLREIEILRLAVHAFFNDPGKNEKPLRKLMYGEPSEA